MARRMSVLTWAAVLLGISLLTGCDLQKQGLLEDGSLPTLHASAGNADDTPPTQEKQQEKQQVKQSQQQTNATDGKSIHTTTYRLKIPDGLEVQHDPGDVVYLMRDGRMIGGINVYSFYSEHQDISLILPKNSKMVRSQPMEHGNGKAVRYVLERPQSDGADGTTILESHTYFLHRPLAYDVWVVEGELSEDAYSSMLKSFHLLHSSEVAGGGEEDI